MTQPNFNPDKKFTPEAHEQRLREYEARQARYALFDELIDFALDGVVTLDEAVAQYKHDAADIDEPLT